MSKPKVAFIGTGGTMSSLGIHPLELQDYGVHNNRLQASGIVDRFPTVKEVADTVDIGWRYYTDRLSASLDAYASNLKNKQLSGYDNASSATIYLSVPELHQRGLNAEASYKILEPLSVYGSYAYTKSTFAADMDSIGADFLCQIRPVVEDEGDAALLGDGKKQFGRATTSPNCFRAPATAGCSRKCDGCLTTSSSMRRR